MRNIKDVLVSWYHHYVLLHKFTGSLNNFFDAFISDAVMYSPFFSHVLEFYVQLKDDNILFVKYEDMKRNLPAIIKQVAEFLNKQLNDDEFGQLEEYLSFASMKGKNKIQ